jgi:predicted outer membrane protein
VASDRRVWLPGSTGFDATCRWPTALGESSDELHLGRSKCPSGTRVADYATMTHNNAAPRSSYATIPIGVFAAVITMSACTANQPPSSPPPSSTVQAVPQRYGATMMQPSGQAAERATRAVGTSIARTPVSDAQLATLDDAHLAGIIEEATDGAARLARVGEGRVTDHKVKRFAHSIAAMQIAAKTRLRARLSELGIEPVSGPVSEQVRLDVVSDLDTLPSASGEDLDRAYVDGQLRDLTRAAELLGRLIGHLKDPGLTEALEWLGSGLDADIRGAQSLRDSLLAGTTNQQPDAYDPDKRSR